MRLVIDTDVMIAGLRSDRGASRQLLLLALDRQIVMLASVPLMLEYEAVATRAEQIEDTNAILDAFAVVVEPVKLQFLWRPMMKDPGDEMVLGTAVNGGADRIATFSVRHLGEAASVLGIRAVQPGEILRRIREVEHAKK